MASAKHPAKGGASPANAASDEPFQEPHTLTRRAIASAVFERCGSVSRREAKQLVDEVINEMVETLTQGETLKLHDFGSFVVREKRGRSGRNPRTGAKVAIEARKVVMFKASPNMKATVHAGVTGEVDKLASGPSSRKSRAPARLAAE